MAETTVTLNAPGGASADARADVVTYGHDARIARAAAMIAGGLLAGTGCVLVPGPHTLAFWVPPLIGIFTGLRALKIHAKIHDVVGPCPQCGERFDLNGGAFGADAVVTCPSCETSLSVIVPEPAAA